MHLKFSTLARIELGKSGMEVNLILRSTGTLLKQSELENYRMNEEQTERNCVAIECMSQREVCN